MSSRVRTSGSLVFRMMVALSIVFLFLLLAVTSVSAATTDPYLIQSGRAASLASADNIVYYSRVYRELWRTDGTTTGTVLIREFDGEVKNITPARDLVFFTVADSELWVSDGSMAGTRRLRTFVGGNHSDGYVAMLSLLDDTLFFSADDGTHGMELWKSDGTPAGTVIVKDINPQPVDNDTYGSRQGWSRPYFLTPFNGVLYFRASDGPSGDELWRSDGTAAGTVMVRDIRPGYWSSHPSYLTVLGGFLLFAADDGPHGSEIWRSDGTTAGTTLVCDCEPGANFGGAYYLTAIGSRVWFVRDTNAAGTEPWVTDGTSAGTYMVKDIYPGTSSGTTTTSFVEWGGRTIFTATDGVYGTELWSSDGTATGTLMIRDVNPGAVGGADSLARTPNGIYFAGYDPANGKELWRSDGTEAGTVLVANLETSSFTFGPLNLTPFGLRLVFTQNDNLYGLNSCAAPDAPSSLTAVASATNVSLNWTTMATAIRYDVYRSQHDCPGGAFEKIAESTTSSYVDGTANAGAPAAYKVLAVNADGCESLPSECAIDICTIPSPGVSFAGANSACGNGQGGTATVDPVSDTGMQYQWAYRTTSGGALADIPSQTRRTYTLRPTDFPGLGTYFLVCRTTSSCAVESVSNEIAVAITNQAAPPVISTVESSVCPGADNGATVMGTYSSYQWSIINGTMLDSGTNSSVMFAAGTTGPVTLSVTVVDNGGCTAASSIEIPLRTIPAPVVNTLATSLCPGEESGAMVSGRYASYQWSIENGTLLDSGTYSTVMFAAGSTSPVRLTAAVIDNGGCAASTTVEIPIRSTITPMITASGPTSFCAGGGVTLTASAGSSYAWSNGATTQSIAVIESGSYSVTVRDANGCSATSAATAVTVHPLPAGTISTSGPTTFCEGGSVTLTAPAGMSSYAWSNGATTQSITVNASGNYSVNVTDTNGCTASSSGTPVTVNPLPAQPVVTANGPTTFCAGGSVTLTASSAASYLWSNGATTQSITTSVSGNYSVTVTNAGGCSATSAPVSVAAHPEVTAWLSVYETACIGSERPASAQAIVGGAYVDATYAWSISGGMITQNSGKNIMFRADSDPLLLTVVITDANGCSVTKSKSVFVTSQPEPVITTSGPTTFCEGSYVTLTANEGSPFGGYLWSNGATTQSILVTESGTYSVTASGNECSATSRNVVVTVLPPPAVTITASGPTAFCEGGSVTLTASGASSYRWSNGATTSSITVTAAGEYTVVGTNANGCSNNMGMIVTTYPAPAATITASGPTTFCEGGSVTLTAPGGYSYAWSNGATTQSIVVTAGGSYSVTTTNPNGCSAASAATTVTVNANPAAPAITASGSTTFCAGGSVTLTAPSGYTYAWSNGATTQSIVVNASGSYSVTTTNPNGCSSTSAATTVTVNANPAAPAITASGSTTFCAGGSVTLTAPSGYSYAWSNGATTPSITVTSPGGYSVTVTNANGCSATSATTAVVVNAKPATPTITASGPTTFCAGGSVTLTAPTGFTYLWSTGATSQSIVASTSGSYSVTVTNASGCSTSSAATNVTVSAATAITQQPQSRTIAKNTTTQLSVTATGTGTLAYQWYRGTSPSTATPISGAAASTYTTPKLTRGTYTYWVRVTGSCGVANSATATITAQ